MDQEQDTNRPSTSSPDGRMSGQTRSRSNRQRTRTGDSESLPTLFELPDLGGSAARIDDAAYDAAPTDGAPKHSDLLPSAGSLQETPQAEYAATEAADSATDGRMHGAYAVHDSHSGPPPNHVDPPFGEAGLNRTGPRGPSVPPGHADPSVPFYENGSHGSGHRPLPGDNSSYPQAPSDDQQVAASGQSPQLVATGSSTDFSASRAAVIVLMLLVVTLSFIAGRSAHQMDGGGMQPSERLADVQNPNKTSAVPLSKKASESVAINLVVPQNLEPQNFAPTPSSTDLAQGPTTTQPLSDAGRAESFVSEDEILTTDELLGKFEALPDEAPSDFAEIESNSTESNSIGVEAREPSYAASAPEIESAPHRTTADVVNSAAERFNEMEFSFGSDFSDSSVPNEFATGKPSGKTAAEEIAIETISLGEPQINRPQNSPVDDSSAIPDPTENRPYSDVADVQTSQVPVPEIPDDLSAPDAVVAYRAESPDWDVGADGIPAGMDNRLQLDEALYYSETPNSLGNLIELAESLGIWDASPTIVGQ